MSFASLISLNGPSSSNARLSAVSSNATVIAVWVTRLTIPEAMSLAFWLAFNQPSPTISPKIKYIIKKCLPYLCVYRLSLKTITCAESTLQVHSLWGEERRLHVQ